MAASAVRVNVTAPIAADAYPVRHRFSGRIESTRRSRLGFELGGRLHAVLVEEGDRVTADQPLATLDTARLEARRRELTAAAAQARSQLSLAEKTLARVTEAVTYRGVSRQEVDEADDGRAQAAAALSLIEAQIASLDVDLEKSTLLAPFTGTVVRRQLDEGAVVAAGNPVLEIEETGRLRARVGMAGQLARTLRPGQSMILDGEVGTLQARVSAVLPARDPLTRTVDVLLDIATPGAVLSGDLVSLVIEDLRVAEGFWLPLGALTEGERGLWTTLVVRREGAASREDATGGGVHRVERRVLQVVHLEDDRAFVTGGLLREDRVLADGTHRVVVGQRVIPVEAPLPISASVPLASDDEDLLQ